MELDFPERKKKLEVQMRHRKQTRGVFSERTKIAHIQHMIFSIQQQKEKAFIYNSRHSFMMS